MEIVWAPINWLAVSMLMVVLEIIAPGYLFLGFAIGAGAVALAIAVLPESLASGSPLPALLVVLAWSVLSMLGWYALRLVFGKRKRAVAGKQDINDFVNRS